MTDRARTMQGIGRGDVAVAAVLSAAGMGLMAVNIAEDGTRGPDEHSAVLFDGLLGVHPVAIPLFLLVTVPLLWRRVSPLTALGAAIAGLLVNLGVVGSDFLRCGVLLPTAYLLAFAAGARLDGRRAAAGLGLAVGFTALDIGLEFGAVDAVVFSAVTAVMWGTGRVVRSRGRLARELDAQTTELRAARDERARLEVATDRARLSGELDVLLQRRLGELATLADQGRRAEGDAATATLVEIEDKSRRTLEEMRAVVGVLRDDAPTAPQPALTHLDALLVRAKGAGARMTVAGSPRVLPAGVELSAYRIVEQLLEALEDAPDVEVRVHFGDDALELRVAGPVRRRAQPAFERARERARIQRGTLEATFRGGRAEAVVSLPVAAAV